MTSDWQPEPRPVPDALREDFQAPTYTGDPPHVHDHVQGWASFLELCDPDSRNILAGFMSVGEPTP